MEISTKNKIINKFLNNNSQKNDNIEGETWEFDNTFNTSDSQSVCGVRRSGDSLVKLNDVNIISRNPSKRNIDDQLKTISEEKNIFTTLAINLCV